jgi:uncharacterized protein
MIESSQIERMSVTERLQAMDQLWDSLNRCDDDSDPVYEALNDDVVILEDAAEDLETGAQFYEFCATAVGDYFSTQSFPILTL